MKCDPIKAENSQESHLQIDQRIAYHQSGHAVAIYLGNQQKQLPPVHFQVAIKQREYVGQQADRFPRTQGNYTANIEGGRLIHSLPLPFADSTQDFIWCQHADYQRAFEADVVNLLAGSLAEAKFVALSGYGGFKGNLFNLSALRYFGGSTDAKLIHEYMEYFIPHKAKRDRKLIELFLIATDFVNKRSNWHKITALAESIRDRPIGTIPYEDVIGLLRSRVTFPAQLRRKTRKQPRFAALTGVGRKAEATGMPIIDTAL